MKINFELDYKLSKVCQLEHACSSTKGVNLICAFVKKFINTYVAKYYPISWKKMTRYIFVVQRGTPFIDTN